MPSHRDPASVENSPAADLLVGGATLPTKSAAEALGRRRPHTTCTINARLQASLVLVAALAMWLSADITLAQNAGTDTPPQAPVEEKVTVETLAALRKVVDEDSSLDDDMKKNVAEQLDVASTALQSELQARQTLAALNSDAKSAGEEVALIQQELAQPPAKLTDESAGFTKEQLQAEVTRAETELAESTRVRTSIEDEVSRRTARRAAIPERLQQVQQTLADLNLKAAVKAPDGEHPLVTRVRQATLAARRQSLLAETALLEQEGPLYEATGRLMTARRDRAARREADAGRRLDSWKKLLAASLRREAERQVREARIAAASAHPEVREIATRNSELTELNRTTVSQLETSTEDRDRTRRRIETLQNDFNSLTQRAEAAHFTHGIGILLRSHRATLPPLDKTRDRIAERQPLVSDLNLKLIEMERERRSLVDDFDSAVEAAMNDVTATNPDLIDDIRGQIQDTLATKREVLGSLTQNLSNLLSTMVALDSNERSLINEVERQIDYIAEHVLWVRSTTAISPASAASTVDAARRLLSQRSWTAVASGLLSDASKYVLVWIICLATVLVLLLTRGRLRRMLGEIGQQAIKPNATEFRPTIHALGLTILLSAAGPIFFWFLSWRLSEVRGADWLQRASGTSLAKIATLYFLLDIFRQVFRPNGLAISHFGWDAQAVATVRRRFWYALILVLPLLLIVELCQASGDTLIHDSLGRLVFAFLTLSLSILLFGPLKPHSPLMESLRSASHDAFSSRVRMFAGLAGIAAPAALGVAALSGYYYTALELGSKIMSTVCLVLGLFVARALLSRWLLVSYRALAIRRNRERREAMRREIAERGSSDIVEPERVPEFHLSDLNAQTGRLVSLVSALAMLGGLWLIWIDVLPALGILKRVSWEITAPGVGVTGIVTLADVVMSILSVAVTLIAARNLPGLLEIAILQRLPLDAGARYAASTIIRYLIFVGGFVTAFRLVGIGWSSVQWLLAAMSVGLGFGLQEIFANFVSGIILLFERPIRVGDTVTINDVTGTVTRIRIRATTILEWNNRELIVPNRDFVTGNLVNWTLSNANLRVIEKVGIAYGSDTELATRLLYEVASENPNILREPEPIVVFTTFGESSLDFELRCFVNSPQLYRTISHSLNMAIDKAFRKNNIEIAFPQRDLHLRSVDRTILDAHSPS